MISVLYVDDEPGLLEICRIFLEQTGEFRVDTVESGSGALARLAESHYDAVVADYQMPEMDGISLLKKIRSLKGEIPFILFTGRGREEVVIEALNNGADFYLQKGGDPRAQFAELMHKVRQAVNRKNAEKRLIESEKRLSDIINFLPDATFAIDRSGRVIAWNRAIEDLTGVAATEMVGKDDNEYAIPFYGHRRKILIDLVFEPDSEIDQQYSGIVRQKDILIAETDLPRPKGRPLTLMGKASPLYDRDGKIAGAIESIRDITARKQAEDELRAAYEEIRATEEELRDQYNKLTRNEKILRESEQKYRTLVENSQDIIYISRDGCFLVINRRAAEVTGYTRDELLRMKLGDLLHPDDVFRVSGDGGSLTRGESGQSHNTVRIRTKSGLVIPLEFIAVTISYQGQDAVMGIARDITEREKHAAEMAHKTKALTIINQIIQTAGRKRSLDDVYDTVLTSTRELLGFDAGGIYLINEGRSKAGIVFSQNLPPAFIEDADNIDIHRHPYDTVFASGLPIFSENYAAINPERSLTFNLKSMASIPIIAEDQVIGALNLASTLRSVIDPDEREVLMTIGKELGSTIVRMRAESALQESETRYRTLVETTGTGYVILDTEGRVADANPEYVHMTGRESLREILGMSVIEWTAPYEQEKNRIAIAECIRRGSIRNLEIDYVSPSGSIIPVEINATIVNNRGSHRIVTLVRDISGRKKAEIALRESENLYGTLADAAQDLIYIINRDDTIGFVNMYAATMLGKSQQEIIGAPRSRFFSGPVGDTQYRNLQQVFTSGMPLRVESTIHLPSKNTWQDTHLVPLKNPEGEVTAIMGISRDITGLRETEVALRESERQYRSIIENMQDMVYRTDLEGRLTMISPAGAALAGYNSPEEMAGLDVARDLYASSQERRKFLSVLSKRGFVTGYPLSLKTRDGQLLSVTASSHFYFDEAGNKQGIEGIIHDITPARRTEDALKEANRKLNLLNSVTRHDVANQLTVLYGYSQLAVLKNSDPVIDDFLHKIDAVTATIGRQIEFSKTYQDLGVQEPGWFGLDAIFTRVRPKGILFSNDCTGIEVFADPMLEKVFLNLFGNAVMHGEHVTRITLHCEKAADGDLLITIEDNGVGIPLQEKPKIFRKGYGKHTGFGLFLAREILAITGISIHETGKHGTGARFEIIVPKDGYRTGSA